MFAGMRTLDAAEIGESFPRFLRRVVSRRESFEIVKEGVPCAYLLPARALQTSSHELAEDLAGVELAAADRHALAAAIRRGRQALKSPKNPWD